MRKDLSILVVSICVSSVLFFLTMLLKIYLNIQGAVLHIKIVLFCANKTALGVFEGI